MARRAAAAAADRWFIFLVFRLYNRYMRRTVRFRRCDENWSSEQKRKYDCFYLSKNETKKKPSDFTCIYIYLLCTCSNIHRQVYAKIQHICVRILLCVHNLQTGPCTVQSTWFPIDIIHSTTALPYSSTAFDSIFFTVPFVSFPIRPSPLRLIGPRSTHRVVKSVLCKVKKKKNTVHEIRLYERENR